jgi:hypothetical protein
MRIFVYLYCKVLYSVTYCTSVTLTEFWIHGMHNELYDVLWWPFITVYLLASCGTRIVASIPDEQDITCIFNSETSSRRSYITISRHILCNTLHLLLILPCSFYKLTINANVRARTEFEYRDPYLANGALSLLRISADIWGRKLVPYVTAKHS